MPNRRDVLRRLRGLGAAATTTALAGLSPASSASEPTGSIFRHGVASGDPDHHSVVLWTRVSTAAPESNRSVRWQLATDQTFSKVVASGLFSTGPERDHTVKVLVGGLEPGSRYYYRFEIDGIFSETGRTRTLPAGQLEQLGIAIASCANYPFGYFNAYEAIASDPEVDLVVHLGDYIYEYDATGWGSAVGGSIDRLHEPEGEIVSLYDYRIRHAQYKSDAGSRAMHAAHPLIAIWDDHESANNPWVGGAENHQVENEGAWAARRDASLVAYYEWMPVRDPQPGHSRSSYWRCYHCGDLASLITLETRHTGRARQIEYGDYLSRLETAEDAKWFASEVLGAPGRDMLARENERFVIERLRASLDAGQPWRLIANQIPMARVHVPNLSGTGLIPDTIDPNDPVGSALAEMGRIGELDLPIYLDTWDGYPEARERFYALCREAGATDLLVLTGDSHAFWANALFDISGRSMGLELGTTGISSPGDFERFGPEGSKRMDELISAHNQEVIWTDNNHRGYVRIVLTHDDGRADYMAVSNVLSRNYQVREVKSMPLKLHDGRLSYG